MNVTTNGDWVKYSRHRQSIRLCKSFKPPFILHFCCIDSPSRATRRNKRGVSSTNKIQSWTDQPSLRRVRHFFTCKLVISNECFISRVCVLQIIPHRQCYHLRVDTEGGFPVQPPDNQPQSNWNGITRITVTLRYFHQQQHHQTVSATSNACTTIALRWGLK